MTRVIVLKAFKEQNNFEKNEIFPFQKMTKKNHVNIKATLAKHSLKYTLWNKHNIFVYK